MLRVGLTGGIGAGKSTVARRLAALGAVLVDADRVAREVVEPGTEGLAAVVAAFGTGVLDAAGGLDRPALGRIVFADEAARLRLNGLLHPRIARRTRELMAQAPPDAVVVHDVPLLVENRMGAGYHLVLVVHAAADERVRRLVADRGMAADDARARVAAQADDVARRAAADVWLDNGGAPDALLPVVDALWVDRLVPFGANVRARRPAPRPDGAPAVPPDPTWPAQAARVVARLTAALDVAAASVTHVGPTARGEAARDVLDVDVALAAGVAAPDVADALANAGFAPAGAGRAASCDPGRAVDVRLVPGGPQPR